ncbi:Uncharacterised protein [Legionella wadsworthii]|uniref:Uncharacterized protein n=1 Tax=Legionella wadsworthii TaxID=28088 RepID=A0A378LS23_9GAMM|nr:hypothetical protein [Legionella wadsworthii]STY29765.1 Uncharacterised protein [Legionella wadsworthii]
MDWNTLASQSPKIMAVMEAIKNDPAFLNELKEDPQQALSKIGVQLNEEEMAIVQKLGELNELKADALGLFAKIKSVFGFKENN